MADGGIKMASLEDNKEIGLKILDNYIEDNERTINEERKAREEEEQQPEDDSPGTVDIQPSEDKAPESKGSKFQELLNEKLSAPEQ